MSSSQITATQFHSNRRRQPERRQTRWPGQDEGLTARDGVESSTYSRSPRVFSEGDNGLQGLKSLKSLTTPRRPRTPPSALPPRLPLSVRGPVFSASDNEVGERRQISQSIQDPWETYSRLWSLTRGTVVMAASTKSIPTRIVAIAELRSPLSLEDAAWCHHKNLLAVLGTHEFEDRHFAVTEYTVATLEQIIAAPLQLEEVHVSAVCSQVRQIGPGAMFRRLSVLGIQRCAAYV
jgi:hypothetical protein